MLRHSVQRLIPKASASTSITRCAAASGSSASAVQQWCNGENSGNKTMTLARRRNNMSSYAKPTKPLMEVITMKVPTMGDSITEGTIAEWTASVGQAVSEGDVVAQVETDKVTVDVKADMDGVIVEHFGDVDDTVEVGADLYKIDTEGKATVAGSYEISPTEEETSSDTPKPAATNVEEEVEASYAVAPPPPPSEKPARVPSIHFLGKDGWAARKSGKSIDAVSADTTPAFTGVKKVAGGSDIIYDGSGLSPMYGRPAFSEDEMEALVTGGASLAPKVVKLSGGAEFS